MEMLISFFVTGFRWGVGIVLSAFGFFMGILVVLFLADGVCKLCDWLEKMISGR